MKVIIVTAVKAATDACHSTSCMDIVKREADSRSITLLKIASGIDKNFGSIGFS